MLRTSILLSLILAVPAIAETPPFPTIPDGFERVLLPIFMPPIPGAHGSEFRTDMKFLNQSGDLLTGYGIGRDCIILCPPNPLMEFMLEPDFVDEPDDIYKHGIPGAFIFLPVDRIDHVVMQLRAYDISREATNFGTEIPVVRAEDMRDDEITFIGVPTDSRFRNTLRIYSISQQPMRVTIEGAGGGVLVNEIVHLSWPGNVLDPAYAAFVEFPANVGPVRVRIWSALPEIVMPPAEPVVPGFWAFVTVTNNDTQHITVMSPQR